MAAISGLSTYLPLATEIKILKSIVHNLAEGVVAADPNGKFLFFNRAAQSILGIGAGDVDPQAWSELYGCYRPDGVTLFPSKELPLARTIRGETVEETEIIIRNASRPTGIHIMVTGSPLINEDGKLAGGVVVLRDVTKNRDAEQRIRTLRNAVEQTADSIVITNTSGLIEYVNPAFEATTGYAHAHVLGRSPSILKSGLNDAKFYREMWTTLISGKVFRATIANRKRNGEIYYAEQTITPMRNAAGTITHYVSVGKDVTELRKLQEHEYQSKLARSVQQRFYTEAPPQVEGFDIAGASFPANATGGDYFDFVPLSQGRVGIAIGDVSGHGLSSALLMVELRSSLRAAAWKSAQPGKILKWLNGVLVSDLVQESFATLIFCRLDPASRSVIYSNAGHLPGYIMAADGTVKRSLDATNIPLGLFQDRTFGQGGKIRLEPGELMLLITDGITDAERPDSTSFGVQRVLDYVQDHRQEPARKIIDGLHAAVLEFSEGIPPSDDITAVICKSTHTNADADSRDSSPDLSI
jgi:PAS domain S-box-containing protein